MKQPQTFTACLALLTLGLTGCSQSEWADSASGESAFAKEAPATTVAELTQRLKDYNASLSKDRGKIITTRMSRNDKWQIALNDLSGAVSGGWRGGWAGALVGGAIASVKTYVIKKYFPSSSTALPTDWEQTTVIALDGGRTTFTDSIGYYHNKVEYTLNRQGLSSTNTTALMSQADAILRSQSSGYKALGYTSRPVMEAIATDVDRINSVDTSLPFDAYCDRLKDINPSTSDYIDFSAEYVYQLLYGNVDDAEEYTRSVLYMIKNGNVGVEDANVLLGAVQVGYASLKFSQNLKKQ